MSVMTICEYYLAFDVGTIGECGHGAPGLAQAGGRALIVDNTCTWVHGH